MATATAFGTPRAGVFVADSTIPGLGASDLVRRAAVGLGASAASLRSELQALRAETRLARDLRGLDANILSDIGLDRSRG
jgi:hypothetical protein